MVRRITIPLAVAAICSVAFYYASLLVTFVDKRAIGENVTAAFASGAYYPHGNDCLLLHMLLADYDTRAQEVLLPKIPRDGSKQCDAMRDLAKGGPPVEYYTYQRYLHGVRTIMAPLVAVVDANTAGLVLIYARYTLLALTLMAIMWRWWRDSETVPLVGLAPVILAYMAGDYIIGYFGTRLSFASSDLAVFAMLLTLALVDLSRLTLERWVVLAALFGAVIAYVELLTGQAPLALALLLAVGAASASGIGTAGALVAQYLWTTYAFVASFALVFAIRMAHLVLTGANTGGFGESLLLRMGGAVGPNPVVLGIDTTQHAMYSPASIVYAVARIAQELPVISLELTALACVWLPVGALIRWRRLPDQYERARTLALVGAALVVPVWYLIFLNHTIIHPGFMSRALVGFTAIGLWLGTTELICAMAQAMLSIGTKRLSGHDP